MSGQRWSAVVRQIWIPANVLPLSAAGVLLAGAVVRVVGLLLPFPSAGALSHGIWYAGLLLTGTPVIWKTLRAIAHGRFNSDLVAMLAVGGAIALRQPLAGMVIVLMQSGGEALERFAEGRASAAVRELEAAAPRRAHRLVGGQVEDIAAEAVAVDDLLLVRPGELVPDELERYPLGYRGA